MSSIRFVCGRSGFEPGRVMSRAEKLTPIASQVNVHHLKANAGRIRPVSVQCDCMGNHVNL